LCLEKEQNYYANSVYFISLQFLSYTPVNHAHTKLKITQWRERDFQHA